MVDDYSYKSQKLNRKEPWPYALGSESDYNLSGLTGRTNSSGYSAGSGANTGSPSIVNNSFSSSGGYSLPAGVKGDILYHNGDTWVVLNEESGTLIMQNATPTWLVGDNGVVVHGDFSEPYLLTAPESGTHVIGSVDGVVQWIETTDCGATGP